MSSQLTPELGETRNGRSVLDVQQTTPKPLEKVPLLYLLQLISIPLSVFKGCCFSSYL